MILYGPVREATSTLSCYLWPYRIEPATQVGTGLRQGMDIHWGASGDDAPPNGPPSNCDPRYWNLSTGRRLKGFRPSFKEGSVVWGKADIDNEDDSIAGFAQAEHFTVLAVPVMELKAPTPQLSCLSLGTVG
jgi:hypothetical protein